MQGLKDMMKQMTHPQRVEYDQDSLQDQAIAYTDEGQYTYSRKDYAIPNDLNQTLHMSHYKCPGLDKDILVYCHSLGNCRMEAMQLLQIVVEEGMELVAFDFRAHGMSQGQKISYGANEADDVHAVVKYIHKNLLKKKQQRVVLFGKSMGAVASLIYCSQYNWNNQVASLILDSPFISF